MSSVLQVTKNCHFISQFLTKPWEGQHRSLHWFDFERGTFGEKTSRKLFAADRINSQTVEDWLSRFVEHPLSDIRPRLAQADERALDDWRFYRAAVLMLWLQGARVEAITDQDARRSLDYLASLDEPELDKLVLLIREEYSLQLIFTVVEQTRLAPLFMPSTGTFRFTYDDPNCLSGRSLGVGLALQQECALIAIAAEQRAGVDLRAVTGRLANCSVGTSDAALVVMPPEMRAASTNSDTLASHLKELRHLNDALVATVHEKRALVAEMYEKAGQVVARDRSGRLFTPTSGS